MQNILSALAGIFDLNEKSKGVDKGLLKDEIARLLKTSPEALARFEEVYAASALVPADDLVRFNAKRAAADLPKFIPESESARKQVDEIIDRVVNELLDDTRISYYDGSQIFDVVFKGLRKEPFITNDDLKMFPKELRPQLSGQLMQVDINGTSSDVLLWHLSQYLKTKNPKKKKIFYDQFRQGLDILDLDPIVYAIISKNQTSISNWFPQLINGVKATGFFKVPKTKIMKVPMPVLQLTRIQRESWTPTTIAIVNRFCHKAFDLDDSKDYFIKTGVFSSKYEFRNAHVHGEKEVQELGEYLLFIHYQACMFASPMNNVSCYGAGTTTDWVVREYIPPVYDESYPDGYPYIYHGLPLRTEYRVFIDGDDKQVLGISPYWKPDVMKKRFGNGEDSDDPDMVHDYITYSMAEESLMKRYEENKNKIVEEIGKIIPYMQIHGQWSIDVMQNGDDFYIIDMALAQDSALKECVPHHLLKEKKEDWIPVIETKEEK